MDIKLRTISAVLVVFVTLPIWFYLLYQILERVQASDLMWFLYIAYMPASLVVGVITAVVGKEGNA